MGMCDLAAPARVQQQIAQASDKARVHLAGSRLNHRVDARAQKNAPGNSALGRIHSDRRARERAIAAPASAAAQPRGRTASHPIRPVARGAREAGVIVRATGQNIVLSPPFVIEREQIDRIAGVLGRELENQ